MQSHLNVQFNFSKWYCLFCKKIFFAVYKVIYKRQCLAGYFEFGIAYFISFLIKKIKKWKQFLMSCALKVRIVGGIKRKQDCLVCFCTEKGTCTCVCFSLLPSSLTPPPLIDLSSSSSSCCRRKDVICVSSDDYCCCCCYDICGLLIYVQWQAKLFSLPHSLIQMYQIMFIILTV